MEQYIGNVFWAPSSRTITQDLNEMKALGINVIRLPLSHQTLDPNDPQGRAPNLKNNPSVVIANSRLALETIVQAANTAGIYILFDIHSCSNYVDWRKGRLDARPPYVDATRDNYDFKREDSSCAATNNPPGVTRIQAYNETLWLQDLQTLAGMSSSLGVSNIIGIDIFNEPWDYTWQEWKTLSEHAYTAINAVNPNILIFVQGISATAGNQDGSPTTITQSPHGSSPIDPNWGENLFEAGANPPAIPRDRLVFSPHAYGPSVFVGKQFMDPAQPACAGLEGDAAGDAQCNIVINPTLLRQGWEEHFGYLKDLGYAVVIGEFGGNWDWPHGAASLRDQNRFGYLPTDTVDAQWQNAFVDYLISKGIRDTIYWSINPESGDTGGIYSTPYRAGTNESAWGTWGAFDSRKVALLQRLWGPTQPTPTPTPTGVTSTPTPTQPSGSNNTGWVSPSNQAAQTGGDGNGFQTSPTSAFADGGTSIATDTNSGTSTSTSCTSTAKDRHAYFNYPLSIPGGSTITGIEVRLDARVDSASGTRQMCVAVSWNNGATWTALKTSAALGTAEATYILGSASDTWGRAWTTGELTSANFRVRITNVSNSTSRDFFLDWAPVRVTYTGGGGVTNTPTPTPTIGPSPTPTPTPTSGGGSTCSPVNATIAAPFTQDGAGTFCWQSSNLGAFVNSWNLAELTINGVNFTNQYVPVGSYPPQINGFWYVRYVGNFPWSHVEVR
ncbi:MAG TPA: cellulase family glycosylhydrolase [Anaerolineae bacterium]|nr:cellulase family glycosylhydrolase [Anaerolineae bacterium]